jgi:hypothetical protein
VIIHASAFDDPLGAAPDRHVHWSSRADWYRHGEELIVEELPMELLGEKSSVHVVRKTIRNLHDLAGGSFWVGIGRGSTDCSFRLYIVRGCCRRADVNASVGDPNRTWLDPNFAFGPKALPLSAYSETFLAGPS